MNKPKKNIPVAAPDLTGNELKYLTECVKTGWISSNGKFVPLFEKEFAKFSGKKFGISTSNGTTALHLALLSTGIGKGDEVIVPALTFVATANAVLYTGAKPIFADSEISSWCLDPKEVEKKITKKTKAIIPVHLYGHPADMLEIMKIAKRYKLKIIEDAAEAHGAKIKEKPVGSFGDINCFSFFGNKTMTTGEGGMIVTDDENYVKTIKLLRDGGRDRSLNFYYHSVLGYNYAMTNMQAAVGVAQLERVDKFISRKREIARLYKEAFKNFPYLDVSPEINGFTSNYWMFSIILKPYAKLTRDELTKTLRSEGIETRPFFHLMNRMPYMHTDERFPVAEYLANNGINLPSGISLTKDDILRVAELIKSVLK